MTLALLLIIIAAALSVYALIESRGRGLLNWAVALIAVALLLPMLRSLG